MSKVEVNQISSQCGSTLTIGQSGDTVTLAAGATQTGFGRTGTVDWDTTAKTTGFTAANGTGYFVNTTSGAITVTLPAGSAGSIVSLKDYANTWQTNNVTVTPNGTDKINGVNADAILSTADQSVTLVYVDSTKGWRAVQDSTSSVTGNAYILATGGTITTCGDYKIHTFTSPGTFTVSTAAICSADNNVDYLVVAGGGGSAGSNNTPCFGYATGGAGAGGFRESHAVPVSGSYTASPLATPTSIPVTVQGYPIAVGGGGAGGPTTGNGSNGSNSIFSTITSAGGGYSSYGSNNPNPPGGPGGSGGGSGAYGHASCSPATRSPGGTGNTPPVSPPQGNPGGRGTYQSNTGGGGGGGAGGNGSDAPRICTPACTSGGDGGAGVATAISGNPTAYTGGGGGGNSYFDGNTSTLGSGDGGVGGGGNGGSGNGTTNSGTPTPQQGVAGTTNTGGGAGGTTSYGSNKSGNAGGSGIVIIRYKYQ